MNSQIKRLDQKGQQPSINYTKHTFQPQHIQLNLTSNAQTIH